MCKRTGPCKSIYLVSRLILVKAEGTVCQSSGRAETCYQLTTRSSNFGYPGTSNHVSAFQSESDATPYQKPLIGRSR